MLVSVLREAMYDPQVTAGLYTGERIDVGTPERPAQLNILSRTKPDRP